MSIPEEMSFKALNTRGAVAGWWMASGVTPLAAYQAKGAASYAASLVNLVTPGTYNLAEGNGMVTWDTTNGWQFVAAGLKYFDTGITPVNNQSWSAFAQFAGHPASASNRMLFHAGTIGGNPNFCVEPNRTTGNTTFYFNGSFRGFVPGFSGGNMGFSGNVPYRNGAYEGNTIPSVAGSFTNTILIAKTAAGTITYTTTNIYALIIFNTTLTGPQAALIAAAMAAL